MIAVYFVFGMFVAVILCIFIMFVLGFVDIANGLIMGRQTHLAEDFSEGMQAILGLITAVVAAVGIPVIILCVLFFIVMLIIG